MSFIVSSWKGALTNRGEKITGGKPPIASRPPATVPHVLDDLAMARLKSGATRPSVYMLLKTGLYGIWTESIVGSVPA